MSDKYYRLRDIPKGKRWKHFLTYYKLHAFFAVILAIMVGYTVYGIAKPYPDLQVMWLSDRYSLNCEFKLREVLEGLDWDTNDNGKADLMLTYIDFDRAYEALDYDTKTELVVLLSAQEYSFFLVNSYAWDWMEENDILGTWNDLGVEGDGLLAIPARELEVFSGDYMEDLENTVLCISLPPADEEKLPDYQSRMRELRKLLDKCGVLPETVS